MKEWEKTMETTPLHGAIRGTTIRSYPCIHPQPDVNSRRSTLAGLGMEGQEMRYKDFCLLKKGDMGSHVRVGEGSVL